MELTLKEILERKVQFSNKNMISNKEELEHYCTGEIKAYNEMLSDICILDEKHFIEKYWGIIKRLKKVFDDEEEVTMNDTIKVEELAGYNNSIIAIVSLINPKYGFDPEE